MTERNEIMNYDIINTFWFHGHSWHKYAVNSLWGFELLQKALQILKFWKAAVIQPLKEEHGVLVQPLGYPEGEEDFLKGQDCNCHLDIFTPVSQTHI